MDQKKRDKIAWVLALLLVPMMAYLMFTNIKKVRERKRKRSVARKVVSNNASTPAQVPTPIPTIKIPKNRRSTIDREVLAKQKKIAALLPKRNPFAVSNHVLITSTSETVPEKGPDQIRVTGIVSRVAPGQRMAIINGNVFQVGERVDKWTIVKINSNNVILDDGTKRITVDVQ